MDGGKIIIFGREGKEAGAVAAFCICGGGGSGKQIPAAEIKVK